MFSYNYCALGGKVGFLKTYKTQDGKPFTCFSLQVNKTVQTATNNLFIDVIAWEKIAEGAAKLLHDGDIVIVEGLLQSVSYKSKSGMDMKKIKLKATKLTLVSKDKENRKLKEDEREYHPDAYQQGGYNLNSPVNPQQDVSQENRHRYSPADAVPPSEDIAQEEPPLNDDYTPF